MRIRREIIRKTGLLLSVPLFVVFGLLGAAQSGTSNGLTDVVNGTAVHQTAANSISSRPTTGLSYEASQAP